MRAGGARKRAECAPATHLCAQHGKSLCITCADWHFLRAARFFPEAQRRQLAARAPRIPKLSKNPPERSVSRGIRENSVIDPSTSAGARPSPLDFILFIICDIIFQSSSVDTKIETSFQNPAWRRFATCAYRRNSIGAGFHPAVSDKMQRSDWLDQAPRRDEFCSLFLYASMTWMLALPRHRVSGVPNKQARGQPRFQPPNSKNPTTPRASHGGNLVELVDFHFFNRLRS